MLILRKKGQALWKVSARKQNHLKVSTNMLSCLQKIRMLQASIRMELALCFYTTIIGKCI